MPVTTTPYFEENNTPTAVEKLDTQWETDEMSPLEAGENIARFYLLEFDTGESLFFQLFPYGLLY